MSLYFVKKKNLTKVHDVKSWKMKICYFLWRSTLHHDIFSIVYNNYSMLYYNILSVLLVR